MRKVLVARNLIDRAVERAGTLLDAYVVGVFLRINFAQDRSGQHQYNVGTVDRVLPVILVRRPVFMEKIGVHKEIQRVRINRIVIVFPPRSNACD